MQTGSVIEPYSALSREFQVWEKEILQRTSVLPKNWDENREKRIKKSEKNFFFFAKTYFPPHWFEFPFSDGHKSLIKHALSNTGIMLVYAGARDSGKTRLFRAFKIWCAIFGKKHFYGKFSDSLDLSRNDLRMVQLELRFNHLLIFDYGEILTEDWSAKDNFMVKRTPHNPLGTLFRAFSTTATPRGELAETRLDFLEGDDFEDYSTSINPKISKEKLEILQRDFIESLGDTGSAVLLANNVRTTCIVNILKEMDPEKRKLEYPNIVLQIVPAWDEKQNRPTWHERYKFTSEEEMRTALSVNKNVWLSEYQQIPVPPEGTKFLRDHWLTYETLPKDAMGIIFCDPAAGKKSDYKAAAMLLYSKETQRFYSPESFCRRCGWEDYFLALYSLYGRYGKHLVFIGWEDNFYQSQYLEFKRLYPSTANRPNLPIFPITVQGEKGFRIQKLEVPYSMGEIWFSKDFAATSDGMEAQSQLLGYGEHPHEDFPDALASAYNEVWEMFAAASVSQSDYQSGEKRRIIRGAI